MRPSTVLDMTIPMLNLLVVQGPQNAKTLVKIYDNLIELQKALVRIENEYDEMKKLNDAKNELEGADDDANRDEQE